MAIINGEITLRAKGTHRRYAVTGKKALAIGLGMMTAAVFMGMAFYFSITKIPTSIPVSFWVIGTFASAISGLILAIFVDGAIEKHR